MTNYVAKVLTLSGAVIADPLPTVSGGISFTEVLSFPANRRLGNFSADLIPPRGANAHYLHIYQQLDYMQRVEIYEDETIGTPVFTGHITDISSDLGSWGISGEEWLDKLKQRRSGLYQTYPFTGLLTDMLEWVLDTWEYTFFDDFTGTLSGWTINAGTWAIASEQLKSTGVGPVWRIATPLNLTATQNKEFKVRAEFIADDKTTTWSKTFTVYKSGTFEWVLTLSHTANETKTNFLLTQSGTDDITRDAGEYELPYEVISSVEFYVYEDGINQVCEIWLNGRQFVVSESTSKGFGGNFEIDVDTTDSIIDNVIIFVREPQFLPNSIGSSSQTFAIGDYEPPQDTYIDILTFLADQLNFEWRTNPKANQGADTIDIAENVGSDLSELVRFEEGINLTNLNLSAASNKITTWFRFAGQGNDVNMALAEIYDKSAIDRYGIIENQLSNQRISTVNLARQVASNELAKVKDGSASLSANVYVSLATTPFRVGDEVWVKSKIPDLNQKFKIIAISHVDGSNVKAITFNSFSRSRSNKIGQLDNDVDIINRGKTSFAAQVILQFKPGSRFIDSKDSRFVYNDSESGSLVPPLPWQFFIKGFTTEPFAPFSPWNGTMSFGSDEGLTASISLATTACRLVYFSDSNIRDCQVQIDGVDANIIDMYSGSPNFQVNEAVDFTGIDWGLHILTFRKEASIDSQANKFITLEGLIVDSKLWHDIFLEGRAINEAYLTITFSDIVSANRPGTEVWINGVNRTIALGGPASGFVSNQSRLDVSQYISAPGLHQIDFKFNDPISDTRETVDQLLEAVLDVRLFV
jgi:hypothetical protein